MHVLLKNVFPQESHPPVQHSLLLGKRLCESDFSLGLTEPKMNHSLGCRERPTCQPAILQDYKPVVSLLVSSAD